MTDLGSTPNEQAAAPRPRRFPRFNRTCKECGAAYVAKRADSVFCCREHKKAFLVRRQSRGAQMYDYVMAMRFDRKAFADEDGFAMLCQLASGFNDEDKEKRDGRKSWMPMKRLVMKR